MAVNPEHICSVFLKCVFKKRVRYDMLNTDTTNNI